MKDDQCMSLPEYVSSQVQCVLGTQGVDGPELHLMAFGLHTDGEAFLMASFEGTRKIQNIARNQHVSIMWDNRTGQVDDHENGWCISTTGIADVVKKDDLLFGPLANIFLRQNPNLAGLVDAQSSVMLHIHSVQSYITFGYRKTQPLMW